MAIWNNRKADPQICMRFEEVLLAKTILTKKKTGINIHDLGFGNGLLNRMSKTWATKGKFNKKKTFIYR